MVGLLAFNAINRLPAKTGEVKTQFEYFEHKLRNKYLCKHYTLCGHSYSSSVTNLRAKILCPKTEEEAGSPAPFAWQLKTVTEDKIPENSLEEVYLLRTEPRQRNDYSNTVAYLMT